MWRSLEVGADGADDHLARVEPHADLEGYPLRAEHTLRVLRHRLLHPERRVAGPHRVVLVRHGGAEDRHDAIAHHLIDRSFVPVDGLHHPFEDGIEELSGLLGIPVGEQFHRALEVGEEDRDLLALALEGALRGEDLLGEVLGGVRLRGVESLSRSRRGR
jgi:hypothetical protein